MGNWYDQFIPPEIRAAGRLKEGDYSGALEAETGHPGTYFRKQYEGQQEQRQGYADAIASLHALADKQRAFQMEGLDRAENYYAPAQAQIQAVYGMPGQMRK